MGLLCNAGSCRSSQDTVSAEGKARTFDYRAGDVGYVPFAYGHYIQNTGDKKLTFLELFKSDHYADISLNQWMALTPSELVQDTLYVGPELTNELRKEKIPVVAYDSPPILLKQSPH
jgi:oxalate decarboxylase